MFTLDGRFRNMFWLSVSMRPSDRLHEKIRRGCRHSTAETGLRANTFSPWTPNLRAVFSLEVARKQSNRAVICTSSRPIASR
jgi:hypothetical protein